MIVRHMAFFKKGRKFALATNVDLEIEGGTTRLIADEGDVGATSGPKKTKITVSSIEPVGGNGMGLLVDMLSDKRLDVSLFPVDGKVAHYKDVSITKFGAKGEAAGATNTGSWEFEAGKPDLTG